MIRSRLAIVAAATSLLALAACEDDDGNVNLGRYTSSERLGERRVEGSAVAQLLPGAIVPFELDVTATQDFPDEADYDFLTSIEIVDVTLFIAESSENAVSDDLENGMADDFAFLSSLALSIEAEIDGETRREPVASVPEGDPRLAEGSRRFSFDTSGVNILPCVEAPGGYRLVTEATGTPPPDDVVFDGSVEYRVRVGFR